MFGRTWPETWIDNNPSFIRDGAYGFHWFHGGGGYKSFPSGHMAATCAVLAVLWICYPRFKPLYLLAGLAVAAGLDRRQFPFPQRRDRRLLRRRHDRLDHGRAVRPAVVAGAGKGAGRRIKYS